MHTFAVRPRSSRRQARLATAVFLAVSAATLHGAQVNETFVGPDRGAWSDPANWSLSVVPNNQGNRKYNVALDQDVVVLLDIDPTIRSLTLGATSAQVIATDHHLTVVNTTTLGKGNRLDIVAQTAPAVRTNLGNLANFSGTEFLSGGLFVTAAPGTTSTLQFNGANIVTNSGRLGLIGAGARIVDQNGANALTNFTTNAPGGFVRFAYGYNFNTARDFSNQGYLVVRPGSTATFNGSFATVIGPGGDDGLVEVFGTDDLQPGTDPSGTGTGNGRLVVNGAFPAYDAATHTLVDGQLSPAANGTASATVQFNDADIVTNNAVLLLYGQNVRIVDQRGNDGLRHLAVNNGVLEFDHQTRTTAGDFANHGTDGNGLFITGDTDLTVAGNLLNDGLLVVSAFDLAQDISVPGFPASDTGTLPVNLTVNKDLSLTTASEVDFDLYGADAPVTLGVRGRANLGGKLTLSFALDDSAVSNADAFTVLRADGGLTGAFDNVASGERLSATFTGGTDPVGTFLVTYGGNTLTVSDYQAFPAVTVAAAQSQVSANGGEPAKFVLTRTGDLSRELMVNYHVSGSAQFAPFDGVKKIKAGQASAKVRVVPGDPGVIKLKLAAGDGYRVGDDAKATVSVVGP